MNKVYLSSAVLFLIHKIPTELQCSLKFSAKKADL